MLDFLKKQLNRLQLSHNNAARLMSLTPRRDHITPLLNELHWLPVYKRCQFKILVITFNALHDQAPGYNASASGLVSSK